MPEITSDNLVSLATILVPAVMAFVRSRADGVPTDEEVNEYVKRMLVNDADRILEKIRQGRETLK